MMIGHIVILIFFLSNQFEWIWDNENTRFGEKLTPLWPAGYMVSRKTNFPKNVNYYQTKESVKNNF